MVLILAVVLFDIFFLGLDKKAEALSPCGSENFCLGLRKKKSNLRMFVLYGTNETTQTKSSRKRVVVGVESLIRSVCFCVCV